MTKLRLLVGTVAALVLAFPLLAIGAGRDAYTATITPATVQVSTKKTYSITLTSAPSSGDQALQATVDVPSGFTVDAATLKATTTAAGSCPAATWAASLNAAGTQITASGTTGLCSNGTLTLQFDATAPAADGSATWTTQLRRNATVFALDSAQPSMTVDGTPPPAPTLTKTPNSPTPATAASFTFTDAEAGATLSCALDTGAFATCTSPRSYTGLADGTHTFAVRAADAVGNISASTTFSWTVDTTPPPAPTITSAPPAVTSATSATFGFSDAEAGATFRCRVDSGTFAACTSPATYGPLADGAHTFDVEAVDGVGNVGPATTASWTIDTVSPVVTLTANPPALTNSSSASFEFSSSKSNATFECALDAAAFAPCTSGVTYTALGDGPHTFHVRATDNASNAGPTTDYDWTVDTVPPAAPALGAAPLPATSSTSAEIVFTGEAGASFECSLDGAPFAPCTSPASYTSLADGSHGFSVRAVDPAGNTGAVTSVAWQVDTIAPETTIASQTLDGSTATFVFTSSDAGGGYLCGLDGAAPGPCVSPQTFDALGVGQHTFTVAAVDAAGNVDPTPASYAWTVWTTEAVPDTTPPDSVHALAARIGYGSLRLAWQLPPNDDFDHVVVFASKSPRAPLTASVYSGDGTSYAMRNFRNGTYYRFAVVSYDHAGNASSAARTAVSPAALLRSPRDGAIVKRPPLLAWKVVTGASYYNVQLYRGSRKVLSAWPRGASLRLARAWSYHGATRRLTRGAYRWFVWPAFGPRAKARYGSLLGQGSFGVR